jgi:hypothetical protein
MRPKLKPPGTERLKLKYEELLSKFGFNFNLRRCTVSVSSLRWNPSELELKNSRDSGGSWGEGKAAYS